jgi:hypothetical protein
VILPLVKLPHPMFDSARYAYFSRLRGWWNPCGNGDTGCGVVLCGSSLTRSRGWYMWNCTPFCTAVQKSFGSCQIATSFFTFSHESDLFSDASSGLHVIRCLQSSFSSPHIQHGRGSWYYNMCATPVCHML